MNCVFLDRQREVKKIYAEMNNSILYFLGGKKSYNRIQMFQISEEIHFIFYILKKKCVIKWWKFINVKYLAKINTIYKLVMKIEYILYYLIYIVYLLV